MYSPGTKVLIVLVLMDAQFERLVEILQAEIRACPHAVRSALWEAYVCGGPAPPELQDTRRRLREVVLIELRFRDRAHPHELTGTDD